MIAMNDRYQQRAIENLKIDAIALVKKMFNFRESLVSVPFQFGVSS